MKKQLRKKQTIDMLPEYDFSRGQRGKYAKRYQAGSNVVVLDPDVARDFPTERSVNETLRLLIRVIRQHRRRA